MVYVRARERPMDMMPPIWLCWRRIIHTKKPTIKATGSRIGSHVAHTLASGVSNLTSMW